MNWQFIGPGDGDPAVVYPIADLRGHDIYSEKCWCHPFWDDGVLVHQSMDRREEYENGRLPS